MKRIRAKASLPRIRVQPEAIGITLIDAIHDASLFAPWFAKNPDSWSAWLTFICAIFALPMTDEQLAFYRKCTGRNDPPDTVAREAWLVCGRRAGKSFILALIAVFLAAFHDYRSYLSPGERGTIIIIATDRKQARVILRYIRALLTQVPMLSKLIDREWQEGFDLNNSITIEVGTASFRSVRGLTIVACLCDEAAYWSSEDSANPDYEILNAIRPGLATLGGRAMLLCASSPYSRKGALWDAHKKHFGKDHDPVLVWQAETREMNPSVPQSFIDGEYERDPASAATEYGAKFRTDVESLLTREAVEACVAVGTYERPFISGVTYSAFVDPRVGSADSFTLAIAHSQDGVTIIDAVRERKPPFSPEAVVEEYALLLKSYEISTVLGDRYAGEWPRERFDKHGIEYDAAAAPKSDIYRDVLPALNSQKVELLDHPRLIQQLIGLERRTARSGKDSIDHAPGGHDDVCNAVCGAITSLNVSKFDASYKWVGDDADLNADWRADRLRNHTMFGSR